MTTTIRLVILILTGICICLTGCDGQPEKLQSVQETPQPLPAPVPHTKTLTRQPQPRTKAAPPVFKPVILTIPAISVHAKVKPVSVLEDGQMDVPADTEIAGILLPGILPGEKGNVVIDGHVDSYTGPAVFFNLKKLKRGDPIVVKGELGEKLIYTVSSVEVFTPQDAPIERIFGTAEGYHLNLITCTGRYSRKKKEHEKRLVVFTTLSEAL